MLVGCAAKNESGLQGQSLSRLAPQFIELMGLPSNVFVYEPAADCNANPRCSGMDRSKKLISISEEGNFEATECGEMRLFRFGNVTHLNVLVAVCGTGPFSPSELKETVGRMQRVLQLMKNDFVNRDVEQSNFWSQLGETRTVAMGAGATAHIFTVAAPPLGYLPTAVVITARQDASFVVQLLIVPDGVQKILSLSNMNDSVETLVKDLYPRLK